MNDNLKPWAQIAEDGEREFRRALRWYNWFRLRSIMRHSMLLTRLARIALREQGL